MLKLNDDETQTIEAALERAARIEQAARAVVERWDTPLWKCIPATAGYIGELRKALEGRE